MNSTYRLIAIVGALLLALMVGFAAWQAGVAHGIEQSGKIVVSPSGPGPAPYPYPYYGWHRPWGSGSSSCRSSSPSGSSSPRGLFWRRAMYGGYGGGCGPRGRFDEWHRQAHARGTGEAARGRAIHLGREMKTILVVDDEPQIAEIARDYLRLASAVPTLCPGNLSVH